MCVCASFDNILAHWKYIVKGGSLLRGRGLLSEGANIPDYTIIYSLVTNGHWKVTRNVWHPANSTPSDSLCVTVCDQLTERMFVNNINLYYRLVGRYLRDIQCNLYLLRSLSDFWKFVLVLFTSHVFAEKETV